jgi:hypothetical protein
MYYTIVYLLPQQPQHTPSFLLFTPVLPTEALAHLALEASGDDGVNGGEDMGDD